METWTWKQPPPFRPKDSKARRRSRTVTRPLGPGRIGRPSRISSSRPSTVPASAPNDASGVFGHELAKPASNHVRILFVNIGGLTAIPGCQGSRWCGSCKDCLVRSVCNLNRVDVLGLLEVNINWRQVGTHNLLESRTRGWFNSIALVKVNDTASTNSVYTLWALDV